MMRRPLQVRKSLNALFEIHVSLFVFNCPCLYLVFLILSSLQGAQKSECLQSAKIRIFLENIKSLI